MLQAGGGNYFLVEVVDIPDGLLENLTIWWGGIDTDTNRCNEDTQSIFMLSLPTRDAPDTSCS